MLLGRKLYIILNKDDFMVDDFIVDDPVYRNHIKNLRSKISHYLYQTGEKVIGITSAVPGEGKSLLSFNLAWSMASVADKKVLLIDCDMIKNPESKGYVYNNNNIVPGLECYLEGAEREYDIIRYVRGKKQLKFIPSAMRRENSTELFSSGRFENLLTAASMSFDCIFLDLPPVLVTPDPVAISRYVGKFLFVYRVKRTPVSRLKKALEQIGREKVIGVVANGVNDSGEKKYYKKYGYYGNLRQVK